jgi:hypothetical protein
MTMDKKHEQIEDLVVETEQADEVKGGQDFHFTAGVIDPNNRSIIDPNDKSLSWGMGGV